MIKFQPLNDRVLVKRVDAEDKSKGGIILPSGSQEKPREGIVKIVGPGKTKEDGSRRSMTVQPGQRVLMPMYAGNEVKIDGDTYVLLLEDEILGVML